MKTIFLIIILSLLLSPYAQASEIFGNISTNPNTPSGEPANPPAAPDSTGEAPAGAPSLNLDSGRTVMPPRSNPPKPRPERRPNQTAEIPLAAPAAEVRGEKIYADGVLVRAGDRKIYIIQGQRKKYIASLKELEKYRGRPILKVAAAELSRYQSGHLNGELIRQRGDVKVYVIIKGGKRHVLNLEELRADYFGLEIFNLSREEMRLY